MRCEEKAIESPSALKTKPHPIALRMQYGSRLTSAQTLAAKSLDHLLQRADAALQVVGFDVHGPVRRYSTNAAWLTMLPMRTRRRACPSR